MRIAAVVVAALLTGACSDSGSPTEPLRGIGGAWTGTYSGVSYECEAFAQATFDENRGSVSGQINVSRPCGNLFVFRGTFEGNTLDGEFTDFDGFNTHGRGTVSGGALEIQLDHGFFGSSRMSFHR
jgi:hypothetical protein